MSITDELARLEELRQRGVLSDEEFARAKAKLLDAAGTPATGVPVINAINALRRSRNDRWVAGVCGGLANATGMASWAWRLAFAILTLFGGVGVVGYVLLWVFVPSE